MIDEQAVVVSRGSSATITTRPIPLTFCGGAIPGPLRGVVLGLSCGVVLDRPIRGPRAIFTALLAFSSASQRWIGPEGRAAGDTPVVTAVLFIFALLVVVFNLIADVLHTVLDPRLRLA